MFVKSLPAGSLRLGVNPQAHSIAAWAMAMGLCPAKSQPSGAATEQHANGDHDELHLDRPQYAACSHPSRVVTALYRPARVSCGRLDSEANDGEHRFFVDRGCMARRSQVLDEKHIAGSPRLHLAAGRNLTSTR